jgi:CRISPR system Cascade subunit CasE
MLTLSSLMLYRMAFSEQHLAAFRQLRFGKRRVDAGYLIHSVLSEIFGTLCPRHFSIQSSHNGLCHVLAYGDALPSALVDAANAYADPLLLQAFQSSFFAAKAMPCFSAKMPLQFTLRWCPIRRQRSLTSHRNAKAQGAIREVDAFLHACEKNPSQNHCRETVYIELLKQQLEQGGAALQHATMTSFTLNKNMLARRDASRELQLLGGRPDATFSGVVEIVDSGAFNALLQRGIGRHRAFGFGMLLVKPKA